MQIRFWKREERRGPEIASVEDIVGRLQFIRMKLSTRLRDMESRYKELFEQVVKAHMEKDKAKAAMYAEELAELRKMLRKLTHASLLLEGVIYRLEAVGDLKNAAAVMGPLRDVLGAASDEVSGIAPNVSDKLRELINSVEEFSINIGYVPSSGNVSPELSEEAKKILEEASTIAAQRRRREVDQEVS